MKKALLYLSLICFSISCIKDKTVPSEPPTAPVVIEVTETPPTPEVDSIQEPPSVLEVIKETPPPVKKKKKKKKKVVTKKKEDYKSLIFNVQLGINPSKKNWVLFKNGTYLIFPNKTAEKDAIRAAKKLLTNYNGNTVFIDKSNFAKGWIASTPTGIYNYIDKGAFGRGIPKPASIEKKGIDNIAADKKGLEIIHVNRPK